MVSKHSRSKRPKTGSASRGAYVFEAMEPRILLSADPLGAAVADALHGDEFDQKIPKELQAPESFPVIVESTPRAVDSDATPAAGSLSVFPPPLELDGLALLSVPSLADAIQPAFEPASELVFVDAGVQDYQQLLNDLANGGDGRAFEIVLLHGDRDGVAQISEALAQRDQLDAVHVLSHGSEAGMQLGSTWLNGESLSRYAGDIAGWGHALTDEGDLLIYGCDLAGSDGGRDLVDRLGALTGADVAASDDLTGHSSLQGDWDLEYRAGAVDTAVAFSAALQQDWDGLLATFTVTNTVDSGTGSLRQAMIDANSTANTGGPDEIHFNIPGLGPHVIAPLFKLPTLDDPVVIDATTQTGYAGTPVIGLDGSAIAEKSNGFKLTAGDSTIRGFAIYRFNDDGIEMEGAGNNFIEANYIGTDVTGTEFFGNFDAGIRIQDSANNIIGGTTPSARNVIVDNDGAGIEIDGPGATNNIIQGNYIGTDATGNLAMGNMADGVWIGAGAHDNLIGGTDLGAGNLISGNADNGITITDVGSSNNVIQGNLIGTSGDGTTALGNASGVRIVNGADNTIGGTTAEARNVISGNSSHGVSLASVQATGNLIQGNYIGTDITGTVDLGNGNTGVELVNAPGNTIGGAIAGAGNVISGNDLRGIVLNGADAKNNLIHGNLIGTDATGTVAIGNSGYGIYVFVSADDNTIGGIGPSEGNVIANNASAGILVRNGSTGNAIRGNSVFANSGLGIDLMPNGVTLNDGDDTDTGANELQNYPVLNVAALNGADLTVDGTLTSAPSTSFHIDFFTSTSADGSGHGEGETFLGSTTVLTGPAGHTSFSITFIGTAVVAGDIVSATATDPAGNTSEFSLNVVANTAPTAGNATVTTDEDIVYTFTETDFNFSDADGDPFEKLRITTLPATSGTLKLDGTDVVLGQEIAVADITSGKLKFVSPPHANGTPYDSFGFQVHDGISYGSNTYTVTVHVTPVADQPTADASVVGPYVIAEGDALTLDGSASFDPDGDTLTYEWDIGNDGSFEKSGTLATYTWAELNALGIIDDGVVQVALKVTDPGALNHTSVFDVTVENKAPTLDVTGAATVLEGLVYTLNLAASDPGDDSISQWTINWGDGNIDTVPGNPGSVTHTYTQPGSAYNITVSATDEDGTFIAGDMVVSSNNTNSLFRFDATTGAFVLETPGPGGFSAPVDVEFGPDGVLYVAGFGSNDIWRYDPIADAFVGQFVSSAELQGPPRFAFGPDGNLYVSSFSSDEVLRFDGASGAFIDIFVPAGGALSQPDGIAFGPDGNLYVASVATGEVLEYDASDGSFIGVYAETGSPGLIDMVFGPGGYLYVSNMSLNKVLEFDGSTVTPLGDFVAAGSGGLNGAGGLTFGPDGDLYVTSFSGNEVFRYDGSSGAFIEIVVTSAAGMLEPANIGFVPSHQVEVTRNHEPVFELAGPVNVDENTAVGTVVANVDANDGEGGSTDAGIIFSITANVDPDGDGNDAFLIDAGTGEITVNDADDLDFEGANPLVITVQADDGVKHSNTDVHIDLNDVNEAPVITSGSTSSVVENTTAVMTVIAGDVDLPGDTLTYSLIGGPDQGLFSIDPASGALSFNTSPDFENPTDADADNVFEIDVQVDDGKGGTDVQGISITVTDANEFPVVNDQSFGIDEDVGSGTVVGTVAAGDVDGDSLSFAIIDGNSDDVFALDSVTGQISVADNSKLDYEVQDQYQLTVEVTDDGLGNLADTATVIVDVNDVNEAPFAISLSQTSVDELIDTGGGHTIATLSASDPDVGDSTSYVIVGGADAARFQIGGAGLDELVLTDGVLDYEGQASYEVVVRATDAGGLSHEQTLTISVNDLAEELVMPPGPGMVPDKPPPSSDGGPGDTEPLKETIHTTPSESEESSKEPAGDASELDGLGSGSGVGSGADNPGGEEETLAGVVSEVGAPTEASDPVVPVDTDNYKHEPPGPGRATLQSIIKAISITPSTLNWVFGAAALDAPGAAAIFSADHLLSVVRADRFVSELDNLRQNLQEEINFDKGVVGSSVVAASGLSVGYVMWLLRGSVLLSSVLTSLPAWRLVDPLPVLSQSAGRPGFNEPDDESLESLVRNGNGDHGDPSAPDLSPEAALSDDR